jgi:hypothetical protein
MNNEEMNQKMEFIVEHQAKFAADIEMMRVVQESEARRVKDGLLGMMDIVGNLARIQMNSEGRITQLAEMQPHTEEGIKRLTEAQARTDARLNIFINVVEGYISGNGGSERHA